MTLVKRLQPSSYHAFRCVGAACEDTCCVGWVVNIDKSTYEAYQCCDDPELGPRLRELVTIHTAGSSGDHYARIKLSGAACPFLSEGWCSIQKKLGEQFLSIMCATYPRVMKVVDDVLERSLDLSCPEAARIVLLDPSPMQFDEEEGADARHGHLSVLRTSSDDSCKPYRYFHEIRALVIWLLQYRAYSLWKRLVITGALCDQLHEMTVAGGHSQIPELEEAFRDAVERHLFDEALHTNNAQPAMQLEMVLELIVARIGSDYTPPRFLACYQEFMQGIDWTPASSMDDIARNYASAFSQHYAPFMSGREYILEHYLVSYVHRTLFPLGPQDRNAEMGVNHAATSIRDQCLLMMAHYAIIQTVLIGLAGFYKAEFDVSHVVKLIQSFAKTFEHSLSFPEGALRILAEKGIKTCAGLAILLRN